MTNRDSTPDMIKAHAAIWATIDEIAAGLDMSASGLAKRLELDSTSFNKSKRDYRGSLRWPSTETIARILMLVGMTYEDFGQLVDEQMRGGNG